MEDAGLQMDPIEPDAEISDVSAEDATAEQGADAPAEPVAEEPAPAEASADTPAEPVAEEPAPADTAVALADAPAVALADAPGGVAFWLKFAALIAFLVLSLAAIVGDYVALAFVPRGVTLVGRDVGNLSDTALRAAIDRSVSTPAMQPLTVTGDGRSWQLDPRGIVTVDENAMVAAAYAPAGKATMLTRLWSRLTGDPLTTAVKPAYSVDSATLARWVAETAATIDREPVDATRTVVHYAIRIKPEVLGATVDETRAIDEIAGALTAEAALTPAGRIVSLPIDTVAPKVTQTSFKKAIVVSLSECRVYLYDGAQLIKTYRCAPGQPAWPTPRGDFVIAKKQVNAPWINPHSTWSVNMPDVIPGGPGNPMGDRKIGINWPGVFLHGIPPSEYGSIGTHASHGCMRMMPASIHDLFPRVQIGDPVFIRG
jgi:lipoprotein-anchoring transpeptidase ErfK/SrfK